jgi:D-glycero-alpha-D-manno-heptose-7-phosphate kinase
VIRVRAPLRLPLGGGGTDLPSYYSRRGGFLVAAALRDAVTVTLRDRGEAPPAPPTTDPWLEQAMRRLGFPADLHAEIASDAPAGCGLGGSGALLVALAHALCLWRGEKPAPRLLAEEAFRIERHEMGRPVGKQDAYVAAYGGLIELRLDRRGSVTVRRLRPGLAARRRLERSLLLADSGRRRDAARPLAAQEKRLAEEPGVLAAMESIRRLGRRIARGLDRGHAAGLGAMFRRHWEIKRGLTALASSAETERCLEIAKAEGARGGKGIGAGGGGFVLLECGGRREAVRQALERGGFACREVRLDPRGSRACAASPGAERAA